jgi:uncharacterized RDD family membrane protein YckC
LDKERRQLAAVLAIAEATQAAPPAYGQRLGLQFAPDEREVLLLPTVELVEASRTVGHSRGGYAEVGITAPVTFKVGTQRGRTSHVDEEATTVDAGRASITTHRVIFQGPKHTRVWKFCDLVGINIDERAPLLYFHHGKRPKTGGLRLVAHDWDKALEHLDVALAFWRGEGDAYVRSLRDRVRGLEVECLKHDGHRPSASRRAASPVDPREERLDNWARQAWAFLRKPVGGPWVPARAFRRVIARIIDGLLYSMVMSAALFAFSGSASSTDFGSSLSAVGVLVVIEGMFCAASGATPGKRRVGTLVIDVRTGEPPSFLRALLRSGTIAVICLTVVGPVIDAVLALLHPERRALHDRVARTLVVRRS